MKTRIPNPLRSAKIPVACQLKPWTSALILLLGFTHASEGRPITIGQASQQALGWMKGHPVMGKDRKKIERTEILPAEDGSYRLYVLHLNPKGYLVLNSDDRLPLVVSFSTDSEVSLGNHPDNAFLAVLQAQLESSQKQLSAPEADRPPLPTVQSATTKDELIGPLMETSWSQCHPYNLYAPAHPQGTLFYGYRTPTGCTNTAFSQVLNYHRWPVHGTGNHSYVDGWGAIQGRHSVDFSDPYDWDSMLPSYDAFGPNTPNSSMAVAELMWELGVAAHANYEGDGTPTGLGNVASALHNHFYYESHAYHQNQAALLPALVEDLRRGCPSVVSIPNHAVVIDGMLTARGVTTFHVNYGWGGVNDGWWSAGGVPGGPIVYGNTSLIPRLMPFPVESIARGTEGIPLDLKWMLPRHRGNEAQSVNLYRRSASPSPWSSRAESLVKARAALWMLSDFGRSGSCWHAGRHWPAAMTLEETFLPDSKTRFEFWQRLLSGSGDFTILASTDDGETFSPVYSRKNIYSDAWERKSVSLAAYAGKPIRLRLLFEPGPFDFRDTGIYVDDLSMISCKLISWKPLATKVPLVKQPDPTSGTPVPGAPLPLHPQPVHLARLTGLPAGTHQVAAAVIDRNGKEHEWSPAFTLRIARGNGKPEIEVHQPRGSNLEDGNAKRGFGTVKVGVRGKARTFVIRNSGTAILSGLKLGKDGKNASDFIISPPSSNQLAPGASITFKIAFRPKGKGARIAAIHLRSNDSNENPFDIGLMGYGSQP